MPTEAVNTAAGGHQHNYQAAAVAIPNPNGMGWIWADQNLPPSQIPYGHEEMHLDGYDHDANQHWHEPDSALPPSTFPVPIDAGHPPQDGDGHAFGGPVGFTPGWSDGFDPAPKKKRRKK